LRYFIYRETLVDYLVSFWSFLRAFLDICFLSAIQTFFLSDIENIFLIGSFGASSVLIYGAVESPLAHPRNLVGGHVVSAIVGVTINMVMPDIVRLTAALAVS